MENPASFADAAAAQGSGALRADKPTIPAFLPQQTFSRRVAIVLAAVPDLVEAAEEAGQRWQLRETARAIGAALDREGIEPERLAARVHARRLQQWGQVRSLYGWMTGRGMVNRGCRAHDCEDGIRWSTGDNCPTCAADIAEARAAAAGRRKAAGIEPYRPVTQLPGQRHPWQTCADCHRPFPRGTRTPADGMCIDCRTPKTT